MEIQKNFRLREFACKCGCNHESYQVVNILRLSYALQLLRDMLGLPIIISSGYRCPVHNKRVKGAKRSYHMHGLAADIVVPDWSPRELEEYIKRDFYGKTGFKLHTIAYKTFLHVDLRHDFTHIMVGLYDHMGMDVIESGQELPDPQDEEYDIGEIERELTRDDIVPDRSWDLRRDSV